MQEPIDDACVKSFYKHLLGTGAEVEVVFHVYSVRSPGRSASVLRNSKTAGSPAVFVTLTRPYLCFAAAPESTS